MAFKVEFSLKAEEDFDVLLEYYNSKNNQTAKEYYLGILNTVKKLEKFSQIGRIVPEFLDENIRTYRELIYENFRIIYKMSENTVYLVRIIDSRRLLELDIL